MGRADHLYNAAMVELWSGPEVGKDMWCGSWKIYGPDGCLALVDADG
jgi:hypothetical protein